MRTNYIPKYFQFHKIGDHVKYLDIKFETDGKSSMKTDVNPNCECNLNKTN